MNARPDDEETHAHLLQSLQNRLACLENEEPIAPPYHPELTRHNLDITSNEQALTITNAAQESLGTAGILASVHMFAFYTPLDQGGLGLALGTAAGLATLGVMSFATVLISIPMAIAAYKNYMHEAKLIINDIEAQEKERKDHREKLFLTLLALRSVFAEDEAKFNRSIKSIKLDHTLKDIKPEIKKNGETKEVNKDALIKYVNDVYNNAAFKECQLSADNKYDQKIHTSAYNTPFPELLADSIITIDDNIQSAVSLHLRAINTDFQKNLDACFIPIESLPLTKRGEAAMEGFKQSLSISGALIGTATTFAGICITAGFCIALSATGWGLIIAAMIVGSILYGISTGMAKQKNLQRDELKKRLEQRNELLTKSIKESEFALTDVHKQKQEIQTNKAHAQKIALEATTQKNRELESQLAKKDRELEQERQRRLAAEELLARYEGTSAGAAVTAPVTDDKTSAASTNVIHLRITPATPTESGTATPIVISQNASSPTSTRSGAGSLRFFAAAAVATSSTSNPRPSQINTLDSSLIDPTEWVQESQAPLSSHTPESPHYSLTRN